MSSTTRRGHAKQSAIAVTGRSRTVERMDTQSTLDALANANRENRRRAARRKSGHTENAGGDVLVLDYLNLVRESDKGMTRESVGVDNPFDKMTQQTCDKPVVRVQPGADVVRSLGSSLVRNDARGVELREQLGATTIYDARNPRIVVGYLFHFEGETEKEGYVRVAYLLAAFSAAKPNIELEDDLVDATNAFTEAVAQLVNRHRVRNLVAGPFHRIVRNRDVAQGLKNSLKHNGTRLHFDVGELDMTTDADLQMFELQALMAEVQYKGTVAGLTNGWLALIEKGQWPKSENQLPALGYRFRAEGDPTPVPDLSKLEMVQDIVRWAGDLSISNEGIAERIAQKYPQWVSPVFASRANSGENLSMLDLRHPGTAVLNLLRRGLPLWATGHYVYTASVPYHLETGKVREGSKDRIEVLADGTRQYSWDLDFHHAELPDGQWCEREELEKAAVRLARGTSKRGRAASRTDMKPLTGTGSWVAAGEQYTLSTRSKEYQLVKRAEHLGKDSEGRALGWRTEDETIVATIRPAELHKSVAESIIDHLESAGVHWARGGNLPVAIATLAETDATILPELRAALEAEGKRIADLEFDLALAKETGSIETAKDRIVRIEAARRELNALQDRVVAAESANTGRRLLAAASSVDIETVVNALALLAQTENAAPAQLGDTLRHVLADFRLLPGATGAMCEGSVSVRVSSSDGPLLLGPIRFSVVNRRKAVKADRHRSMLRAMLVDGLTLEQTAEQYGYKAGAPLQRTLRTALSGTVPNAGLRAAIFNCPVRETRVIVWNLFSGENVPVEADEAFVAHVVTTYTDRDRVWAEAWAADTHAPARMALDWVKAHRDADGTAEWEAVLDALTAADTPLTTRRHLDTELTRGKGTPTPHKAAGFLPVFERVERDPDGTLRTGDLGWTRWADRRVRVQSCEHCGGELDHVLRVPEIPGGMLCSTCLRAPGLEAAFPADYGRRWCGHRGFGQTRSAHNNGTYEEGGTGR